MKQNSTIISWMGRLFYSKTGKDMAEMSDTRLITVRTHLIKILEKTIMFKLLGENSDLIKIGRYSN